MKAKIKHLDGCVTQFAIEIPRDMVARTTGEVYGDLSKVAEVPGFRTGKAPVDLVKKHHSKKAKEEILRRLISQSYTDALKEHSISPISDPEVSDIRFEEDRPVTFTVTLDRRPDVSLKSYRAVAVRKPSTAVSDEDAVKALEQVRQMHARFASIEDAALAIGHYAVCDIAVTVDGKTRRNENAWFFMDDKAAVPELAHKMVGAKKLERREFDVTFPGEFPDPSFAGKIVHYAVEVKEIKEKRLPEIDDAFAKEVGTADLASLRKALREELERQAKVKAETDMKNQIIRRLIEENDFEVPASMVKRQLGYMVEDAKERLVERGFAAPELDKNDTMLRDKYQADAVKKIRLLFILSEIAQAEKIGVSDKDIDEALESIARETAQTPQQAKEYYVKHELMDSLAHKIREEKVLDFLLKEAKIQT